MTQTRLIWTQRALDKLSQGKVDPMHTISAPNIVEVYGGFVLQLRAGTPWALVAADGTRIAEGRAV